jgi:hypothetical protein
VKLPELAKQRFVILWKCGAHHALFSLDLFSRQGVEGLLDAIADEKLAVEFDSLWREKRRRVRVHRVEARPIVHLILAVFVSDRANFVDRRVKA